MMKFLICPASQDQIEDGDYDLFKGQDGATYNYAVEFYEDDMVTLRDTVGRYVPMGIEELKPLINMLQRISNYQEHKERAQAVLISNLLEGVSRA